MNLKILILHYLYNFSSLNFTVIESITGGRLHRAFVLAIKNWFFTVIRPRSATRTFADIADCGIITTGALILMSSAKRELRSANPFTPVAAFSAVRTVASVRASLAA